MAGPFDVLHIKRRTAGSSNELSFDVLEAARDGVDIQQKRHSTSQKGSKRLKGSYHGVTGTATFSAVPEVERRKKARRAHSRRLWIIAVIAVAALVGTAAFFGYRYYQEKVDFKGHYNVIIDRFMELDKAIVQIDSLMEDPENPAHFEEQKATDDIYPQVNRELNAIIAEANSMEADARGNEDKAALSGVEAAAQARQDMLEAASATFALCQSENKMATEADSAWGEVINADETARRATAAANAATTHESTQEAQVLTDEARGQFVEAREKLAKAVEKLPVESFETEFAYIDKRIEALDAALETADALLAGDREAARQANAAYNEADHEAVVLAEELSTSPGSKVRLAFKDDIAASMKDYKDARSEAAIADSTIRAYL